MEDKDAAFKIMGGLNEIFSLLESRQKKENSDNQHIKDLCTKLSNILKSVENLAGEGLASIESTQKERQQLVFRTSKFQSELHTLKSKL